MWHAFTINYCKIVDVSGFVCYITIYLRVSLDNIIAKSKTLRHQRQLFWLVVLTDKLRMSCSCLPFYSMFYKFHFTSPRLIPIIHHIPFTSHFYSQANFLDIFLWGFFLIEVRQKNRLSILVLWSLKLAFLLK